MLHDVMCDLVNQHAWAYIDPTGEVRRKLTRKVIMQYYEPRLEELDQQIRAQLEPTRVRSRALPLPMQNGTAGGWKRSACTITCELAKRKAGISTIPAHWKRCATII